MATSISVSVACLAGGADSAQRGYIGYSASKAWVMRYEFTTPAQTVTSLTFRAYWYQFNLGSYPIRAQVTTSSTSYVNAIASNGYSYIGSVVAETSGSYNVAVHLSGLNLTANTKYYLYLFPDSNYGGNYRHLTHNANAGQTNYLEVTTHTHSYTSVVTQPTCTAQGYTTHKCSCGSSYVDTYTSALGHSYTSKVTKQPTCVATGIRTYTCSTCGASYTETIAATGVHSYTDATCTKPQTCTVCGSTTGSALGHNYVDTVTQPTCTAQGYTTHKCSVCDDCYEDTYVSALGHNYVDNICVNCGISSIIPFKKICYIYNGTEWVKHLVHVSNKRRTSFIYECINPETSLLGYTTLGVMKLGEGG